ncbi:MAG TPA: cytochrome c [Candidatus Dormibacteraeota bacterium]|nr:cytochrome c [Candidatus Dormibacteraeota bacterium]
MRGFLLVLCLLTFWAAGISFARQDAKEKPKENATAAAAEKTAGDDPVRKSQAKPSAEAMAEARKMYGYDCAMCHGAKGDGKGDLAEQMKLDLRDWRDASSIANKSDGELFTAIAKGKGKMPGSEGNRMSDAQRWNLVSVVRSFGGKGTVEKTSAESKP